MSNKQISNLKSDLFALLQGVREEGFVQTSIIGEMALKIIEMEAAGSTTEESFQFLARSYADDEVLGRLRTAVMALKSTPQPGMSIVPILSGAGLLLLMAVGYLAVAAANGWWPF